MLLKRHTPPRQFKVKRGTRKDCASIDLDSYEQVTFVTPQGSQYDVTKMPWGFFATPSMNYRLPRFGLRAGLIRTPEPRYHIILCEVGKEDALDAFLKASDYAVLTWFDSWT